MEKEENISLSLDGNAQSFEDYLNKVGDLITTKKAKHLRQVTIMDQSIKQYIIGRRNQMDSGVARMNAN